MNKTLLEFFSFIVEEVDYTKTYMFIENGNLNLWLIVESLNYESTIKYIRLIREIIESENNNIKVMLYDVSEEDEVLEELKNSDINFFELKK